MSKQEWEQFEAFMRRMDFYAKRFREEQERSSSQRAARALARRPQ